MLGAIGGDIIGSVFEHRNVKSTDFPLLSPASRFTDDTVLTVAVGHALLDDLDFCETIKSYARSYPNAGYGGTFRSWIYSPDCQPYNSWGNGSAMRVSPVGWAFDTTEDVLEHARRSSEVTHNHPEGIKGAKAVALAVFLARKGESKETIRSAIENRFSYGLSRTLKEIRPGYRFDVSCQGSVPEAIISFLESSDYETAVRNAVSLGGDSDTIACIAGSIAEAYYKEIPDQVIDIIQKRLPQELKAVVERFYQRFVL